MADGLVPDGRSAAPRCPVCQRALATAGWGGHVDACLRANLPGEQARTASPWTLVGMQRSPVKVWRRFLQGNAFDAQEVMRCCEGLPWAVPKTATGTMHREMATVGLPAVSGRDVYGDATADVVPYPPCLDDVRKAVEAAMDCRWTFNVCLLNRYRSGEDYVGPHSDHEERQEPGAPIVSVSLGATRDFVLASTADAADGPRETRTVALANGDLLVMPFGCQQAYKHCVPARKNLLGARVSLTFRVVRV